MTQFYSLKEPIKYEGPDAKRARLPLVQSERRRSSARPWPSICALPSATGTRCAGRASIPSAATPSSARGITWPDQMAAARIKADVMFETLHLLGVDFFSFHDLDIAPEGKSLKEFNANVTAIANIFEKKMAETGKKLLWGTANMFSNRRFMAGAATNPDPDVFAYCAAQVKHCLDVTKGLGGENYVMWGGREGYETLLNTNIGHELDQVERFLSLVVEYKHKIGFKGPILIEPKPQEPTKHQYDYDVATFYGTHRGHGPAEGREAQHRAEPRDPRRPHLRARDRAGRGARHLRLDRHQPRRLSDRAGTPTSSP